MFISYFFLGYVFTLLGQNFDFNYFNNCNFEKYSYSISGNSMYPLLKNNTKVLVAKNYYNYCKVSPKKNDIIIFLHKNKFLVKKIFALEGDIVGVKNNQLLINNKVVVNSNNQSYKVFQKMTYIDKPIPKNYLFVLGDNVMQSKDSRAFGLLHEKDIEGMLIK